VFSAAGISVVTDKFMVTVEKSSVNSRFSVNIPLSVSFNFTAPCNQNLSGSHLSLTHKTLT
jgi:hypothetical protein